MVDRVEIAGRMGGILGRPVEPSLAEWVQALGILEGHIREGMEAMYRNYEQCAFPGGDALVPRAVMVRKPRTLQELFKELASQTWCAWPDGQLAT